MLRARLDKATGGAPSLGQKLTPLMTGHHRKLPVGQVFSCHRSRAPMGAMPSEQKPSAFR